MCLLLGRSAEGSTDEDQMVCFQLFRVSQQLVGHMPGLQKFDHTN